MHGSMIEKVGLSAATAAGSTAQQGNSTDQSKAVLTELTDPYGEGPTTMAEHDAKRLQILDRL